MSDADHFNNLWVNGFQKSQKTNFGFIYHVTFAKARLYSSVQIHQKQHE